MSYKHVATAGAEAPSYAGSIAEHWKVRFGCSLKVGIEDDRRTVHPMRLGADDERGRGRAGEREPPVRPARAPPHMLPLQEEGREADRAGAGLSEMTNIA